MSLKEPMGYDYNDGGISNQKIALLGLVVSAASEAESGSRRIYLPKIYSRDQHDKTSSFEPFDKVFWGDTFRAFLSRWGVEVVPAPDKVYEDRIERGGWNLFSVGCAHLTGLRDKILDLRQDIAADFFRSLVPQVASSKKFCQVADAVFTKRGISTVSQMRIEEDWVNYSKISLAVLAPKEEEYLLAPEEIIAKVSRSLPGAGPEIFVLCDERYLVAPKSEIRDAVRQATGLEILWKSDILPASEHDAMSPLDASLMDFELGARSENFVGLSWSTFSNLMAFERYVRTFKRHTNDFIYNKPGPFLGRRTDIGSRLVSQDVCDPMFDPDQIWPNA